MILIGIGPDRLRIVSFQKREALQKWRPTLITVELVCLGGGLQEGRRQKNSQKKQSWALGRHNGNGDQIDKKTGCQPQ